MRAVDTGIENGDCHVGCTGRDVPGLWCLNFRQVPGHRVIRVIGNHGGRINKIWLSEFYVRVTAESPEHAVESLFRHMENAHVDLLDGIDLLCTMVGEHR